MVEIACRISSGEDVSSLRDIRGTAFTIDLAEWRSLRPLGVVEIPGFSEVAQDKSAYARAFALHYAEQDPVRGKPVVQPHPKTVIIQNPPALPLTTQELDHIYDMPFSREALLELLQTELARDMAMCGKPNLKSLDPGVVKIHARRPSQP